MKNTATLHSLSSSAFRLVGPPAADAVRNPLVRNGVLLLATVIAVTESRYTHKHYGFSKFIEHTEKWHLYKTDQYETWKKQHDEHWTRIGELQAEHAATIAELSAELIATRGDESDTWEYWSDQIDQKNRTIVALADQLADASTPPDPLDVPDDTPGLAAGLLETAQAHLRRFRHVSNRDPHVPPCTAQGARDHAEAALEELEHAHDCSTSGVHA